MWRRELLIACAAAACARPPCVAGLTGQECAQAMTLVLAERLPAARGNRFADSEAAASLGFHVFYDARFSSDLEMRCATCHAPETDFQDSRAQSPGRGGVALRNSPTLLNAARLSWMFWDGRADSVWSQPLLPLENPAEMNLTRLEIAHRLSLFYPAQWEAAFGPFPDLSDASRFPPRGKPGMPEWEAMAPADQALIDDLFARLGKAMEAYLRKLAAGPADFDRAMLGRPSRFSDRRGLRVFLRAGCAQCHSGPMLTDEQFHALAQDEPDPGRAGAQPILSASPFTARGPHWDGAPPPDDPRYHSFPQAAFRTPSLRNLTHTAPYGHAGRFATLEEAIAFHLQGGGPGADPLLRAQSLSSQDFAALASFLRSLQGDYPKAPWNNWPEN